MLPLHAKILGRKNHWPKKKGKYIKILELKYSLDIEATDDPEFFGFYSPELEGITGVGNSVEDCLCKAKWGMLEHVNLLKEKGLPVPRENSSPTVTIQNEKSLEAAA